VTTVSRTTFHLGGARGDQRVRVDDREMGRWRTAAVPPQIAPAAREPLWRFVAGQPASAAA
jgi:hypothetical protein